MRVAFAWAGIVVAAIVVACGELADADAPEVADAGGDARATDAAAGDFDSGCPGHTFCEDFDRLTEAGTIDLSRWPGQLRADTLALSDAGATTPPFALWISATDASLVRSSLSVPLPTARTHLHCTFDARFAAVPGVSVRVFQVKFHSGGSTSFYNLYGSPSGFELGIHEETDGGGSTNSSDVRSLDAGQAERLVPVDVVFYFDPSTTHARATIGGTTLTLDRPRDGDLSDVEIDVGLTNNNLPDAAGTVDVRLDSLVCDAE